MQSMKHLLCFFLVVAASVSTARAQNVTRDIPYATAHERQVLDVYAATGAKNLPVVFWIHGGGWQAGNKSMVGVKPKAFMEAGFVFVSINYRLLPTVDMTALTTDVATALGWVHKNIAKYGGDPDRLLVMGHSAGGQLAALMCTDEKYVKAEGFSLTAIKGCMPVDADTFDVPAIIEVAETRARVHHLPLPTNGHRQKFGNDPAKHLDFSAVTHVAAGKGIPPFLILHISGNPDTSAQARRLAGVLQTAGVLVKVVGRETTHEGLNDAIGVPDDPVTKAVLAFVAGALEREGRSPARASRYRPTTSPSPSSRRDDP
jgi:acetyl esterase/lipase